MGECRNTSHTFSIPSVLIGRIQQWYQSVIATDWLFQSGVLCACDRGDQIGYWNTHAQSMPSRFWPNGTWRCRGISVVVTYYCTACNDCITQCLLYALHRHISQKLFTQWENVWFISEYWWQQKFWYNSTGLPHVGEMSGKNKIFFRSGKKSGNFEKMSRNFVMLCQWMSWHYF